VRNIIGDVEGRHCVLIDDIVDSAGTLCNAADALMEQKAASVTAYVAHAVLSNGAAKRVQGSQLAELVVTDSIDPTAWAGKSTKVRAVSIAELMGEAIRRIANEESISVLFE
jgi:ribose-phosphate pyrophosphokinase